jgi:hypothetical protein
MGAEIEPVCWPCPTASCTTVFDRVVVSYLIPGQTRVAWTLRSDFLDPGPYAFQLQVGTTASNDSNDWVNVGLPVNNMFFAIDPVQRVFGKTNWTHYRIVLTTKQGTYFSLPTGLLGTLGHRDWRLAREIVRKETIDHRLASQQGYLLKRRVTGVKCPICLDFQTDNVLNPECPSCYGTSFECGYFYPVACVWAKMRPKAYHTHLDNEIRGTVKDVFVGARMLMTELFEEEDVWVNKDSDDRYFVHDIVHASEIRGVPIIGDPITLRLIPYSSIIYTIGIPDQLAAIGAH